MILQKKMDLLEMFNIMLLKRDLLLAKALLKPEFGQLLSKSASWWLPAFLVFLLHLDLMYMILEKNVIILLYVMIYLLLIDF